MRRPAGNKSLKDKIKHFDKGNMRNRLFFVLLLLGLFFANNLLGDQSQTYNLIGQNVEQFIYRDGNIYIAHQIDNKFTGGISIYFNFDLQAGNLSDLIKANWYTITTKADGLSSDDLSDMQIFTKDGKDTLIASYKINGLNIVGPFPTFRIEVFNQQNSLLLNNSINDLLLIDTQCYIATESGLNIYDVLQDTITNPGLLANIPVKSLYYDSKTATLWIVSAQALYKYTAGSLYKVKTFTFNVNTRALLFNDNQVFIGTKDGLYSYSTKADAFIKYKVIADGIEGKDVRDIVKTGGNYLLIATYGNGVFRYSFLTHSWDKHYYSGDNLNPISSSNVNSITVVSDNVFIFSTDNGFTKYTISNNAVPGKSA